MPRIVGVPVDVGVRAWSFPRTVEIIDPVAPDLRLADAQWCLELVAAPKDLDTDPARKGIEIRCRELA